MTRCWQRVVVGALIGIVAAVTTASAQRPVARPQPPPVAPAAKTPTTTANPAPSSQAPVTPLTGTEGQAPASAASGEGAAADTGVPPSPGQLNAPVFPTAQYLGSYDAGQGQSFYLYGSTQSFGELVLYYRNVLKDKGELVFDAPATHMFEIGKFKETEVAFPPGVTIKDYTWNNSPGYLNPKPGGVPAYFPTVIQIVPPPGPAGRRSP